MDIHYAKAALYAYPTLKDRIVSLNESALKTALKSRHDRHDALTQCEEVVKIQSLKFALCEFRRMIKQALSRFNEVELAHLNHKYFTENKSKEYYENCEFDFRDRRFFRTMAKIEKIFAYRLELVGADDRWIEFELKDFIKPFVDRAIQQENNHQGRRGKKKEV